ncbi:MAG: hypothetical protein V3U57_04635 [Robiginitomaculum sp.]
MSLKTHELIQLDIRCRDAHVLWEPLAHNGIYVRKFESNKDRLRMGLPKNQSVEIRLASALNRQW